ncbi:MAG TPA: translation initiation factor IF-2 [Syntrophomonadaceae bacterium]|nr:translation initiation factor IF-2 [Syntrophomonadaceae bacterium]HQA06904.1 translation initiation factor IF-2 [Syntrophomonadaceae bacterium]HQE22712.1 translation initiation factor IF-2 [Syntrophomonadaceae bacterium]
MAKIRVHELAKEIGMPSKQLVDTLQAMGLNVKNHMSTMEENQVSWVKKKLQESASATAKAKQETKAAKDEQVDQVNQTRDSQARQQQKSTQEEQLHRARSQVKDRSEERSRSTTDSLKTPPGGQPKEQPSRADHAHEHSSHESYRGSQQQRTPQHTRGPQPSREQNKNIQTARDQRGGQFSRGPQPYSSGDRHSGPAHPQDYQRRAGSQAGKGAGQPRHQAGGSGRPYQSGNRAQEQGKYNPPLTVIPTDRPRSDAKKKPAKQRFDTGDHDTLGNKAKGKQLPSRDFSRPVKKSKHKRKKEESIPEIPSVISIPESITIRDLADKLYRSPAEVLKKLMDLGTMATINQEIDFETAEILAALYEVSVEREVTEEQRLLEEIIDDEKSLKPRPPVVTVMGHVDHGKTSLLDRIRKSDVASGEAGGITQHIGAYQVKVKDNRITFIDTPGHEAFTAMRARGANLTDIVILVVAADDGVMPQTIEAISHIRAAKVPFLVAVNKIDKPTANPDKVMQQLTEYNIVPEEWGGDTIFVPVSAKTGEGIDQLLEMVLLLAEMNDLRANPDRPAEGIVIEGELDKGRGPVATVLVQKGTLRVGDYLVCGVELAKVRAMTDYRGRKVEEAYPSMPVEIMGWSDVPQAGEKVRACDEKVAKEITSLRLAERKMQEQKQSSRVSLDDFFKHLQTAEVKELNLIVKGDVQGSVEALTQSLIRLSTEEVKVNVIHSGVGAISETDVMLASASNAIIIGFNVRPDSKARKYAEEEHIDVRLYRVIYEAIEDVKKAMSGLLDPEYKEKYLGRAEVRALFKVPNVGVIAGSYVIDGKIQRNAEVRVLRNGVIVYEGQLSSLKRFKDDAKEVPENYECGIGIKDFNDIKEGDTIEAFILEEVPRQI